jgi:hypothetical protein
MNTQRLYTLSKILHGEMTGMKLINTLTTLVSEFEAAVNGSNEATQRAVENRMNELSTKLVTLPSNELSPGLKVELDELRIRGSIPARELVGTGLVERLKSSIENGYTVKSLDGLRQLLKDVQALVTALEHINSSFSALNLEDEQLPPGEAVVGMLIPHEAIDDSLRGLQREVRFFANFLALLTEAVEGHYEDNKVYSIHASLFGIESLVSLDVAVQYAQILGGIKIAYELLRGFRKLKQDAKKLGVEDKVTDQLTEKGTKEFEEKLDAISVEIYRESKIEDGPRKEELKSGIRLNLNGLANRVDQNFIFEVRVSLPKEADPVIEAKIEPIKAFSKIRFEPLEGSRVLELPEPDGEEDSKTTGAKPAKKKPKAPTN